MSEGELAVTEREHVKNRAENCYNCQETYEKYSKIWMHRVPK